MGQARDFWSVLIWIGLKADDADFNFGEICVFGLLRG